MKKYKKLPFDLKKALAGHPLVTSRGYSARVVDNSRKADDGRSLIALLSIEGGEELRSYHADGTCGSPSKSLYLLSPMAQGWINVCVGEQVDPKIYDTELEAVKNRTDQWLATVPIEWEDNTRFPCKSTKS